tara:strand:- start:3094 stop:3408 length:315 start_codon:yes stop_codon:yes gene_type:complete
MSLNIISYKSGGSIKGARKVTQEETAEQMCQVNDQRARESNAGYMERQRQHRKQFEGKEYKGNFRPTSTIDAEVYMRHAVKRPGCWADPGYKKEFLRDNPECKL